MRIRTHRTFRVGLDRSSHTVAESAQSESTVDEETASDSEIDPDDTEVET